MQRCLVGAVTAVKDALGAAPPPCASSAAWAGELADDNDI